MNDQDIERWVDGLAPAPKPGRPRTRGFQVDPLATAIRARRQELDLSLAEVARRRGLPANAQYQSNVETGRQAPNLATLRSIADALDCDIVLVPRSREAEK